MAENENRASSLLDHPVEVGRAHPVATACMVCVPFVVLFVPAMILGGGWAAFNIGVVITLPIWSLCYFLLRRPTPARQMGTAAIVASLIVLTMVVHGSSALSMTINFVFFLLLVAGIGWFVGLLHRQFASSPTS